MKAKEFLLQIQKLDKLIDNKIVERSQWTQRSMSMNSVMSADRVQTTPNQQKMELAVVNVVDYEKEINDAIEQLWTKRKEITSVIESLNTTEYDILHKMYSGVMTDDGARTIYMTLDDIANEYGRSYSWATSIHGSALNHVQKILNEKNKKL